MVVWLLVGFLGGSCLLCSVFWQMKMNKSYLTLREQAVTYSLCVNISSVCPQSLLCFYTDSESLDKGENTFVSFLYSR